MPWVTVCWLAGMTLGGGLVSSGAAAGLGVALVALGWWLRRRAPAGAALGLLGAAVALGVARAPREDVTAGWREIPAEDSLRVTGTVRRGCTDVGPWARCDLDTVQLGMARMVVPAGQCRAIPGDRVTAVVRARVWVPMRNAPLPGASTGGIGWRLQSAGCEVIGRDAGPLDAARAVALRIRRASESALSRAAPPTDAGRMRALLFGDTQTLRDDETAAFRDSGLAHLLAVSGAHVSLVLGALGWVLRRALVRVAWLARRNLVYVLAAALPLPAAALFVLVTGESAAAQRALWTGTLSALAALSGRRADPEATLAAVALAMSAWSPTLVHDLGWTLSVVASWALVQRRAGVEGAAVQRDVSAWRAVGGEFVEALRTSVRAGAATLPVLAGYFARAPGTALVLNALAAPLGEVLGLPLTVLGAVGAAVLPGGLARWVVWPSGRVLEVLFALPQAAMRLPGASLELPMLTAGQRFVAVLTAMLTLRLGGRRAAVVLAVGAATLGALEWRHRVVCHPRGVLRVTALDVGQGDALVVDLPDGSAMLVDAGGALHGEADPGARVVVPWLRLHRRTRLAAVVLSHPHPDHAGGLAAVLDAVQVDALWDTGQGEALGYTGVYGAALAAARRRGVPLRGPTSLCGAREFHGARVEVLAPCPAMVPSVPANDASFVLRLAVGRGSVLLPGDLERAGEAEILARLAPTTVLKLGHHGSRTSTTDAFLDRLRPAVALVSCGHPSPFGHPHPSVLQRLRARAIPLRRTDLSGVVTVTVRADGSWR
jgi:competence protein ComEC